MAPRDAFSSLPNLGRSVLGRAILLSLCLHLALLAFVRVSKVREMPSAPPIEAYLARPESAPERVPDEAEAPAAHRSPAARPVPALPTRDAVVEVPAPLAERRPPASALAPLPRETSALVASAQNAPLPDPTAIAVEMPMLADTHWYGAREVDRPAKALERLKPTYPMAARRRGIEGTVKLHLRIDERGRVQEAEVVEAVPPGVFEAAALETAKKLSFEPAQRGGRPVRYDGAYRYDFVLD